MTIQLEIVREIQLTDVTFIIRVSKDDAGDIKKGIRHAMDSPKHGKFTNRINYVYDNYDIEVVPRDNYLETIVTYANIVVRLSKYVPESNMISVVRNVLKISDNVTGVGDFEIEEHYLIEAKTNNEPES